MEETSQESSTTPSVTPLLVCSRIVSSLKRRKTEEEAEVTREREVWYLSSYERGEERR
jgi:hypothetical protein